MNKYFKLAISVVLVIVSLIVILTSDEVYCGKGSGINEKIKNLDEFSLMMNDLFNDNEEEYLSIDKSEKKEYTSATFTVYTKMSTIYDYEESNDGISMDRKMIVYHTKEEAYYIVDATILSIVDGKRSETKLSIDYYFNFETQKGIMKINDFNNPSLNPRVNEGLKYIIGEWIDHESLCLALISVAVDNLHFLEVLGGYINKITPDDYTEFLGCYFLSPENTKKIIGELINVYGNDNILEEALGKSSTISYNLQDKFKPVINTNFTFQYDSLSMSENLKIEFYNINNTIINLPEDIDLISEAELDKILEVLANE